MVRKGLWSFNHPKEFLNLEKKKFDYITPIDNFDRKFEIIYPPKKLWANKKIQSKKSTFSLMDPRSGAGPTIKSEHKCCNVSTKDINSFHFWCDCPSLAKFCFKHFGQYFLYDLPTIKNFSIETFVEFVTKSEWF